MTPLKVRNWSGRIVRLSPPASLLRTTAAGLLAGYVGIAHSATNIVTSLADYGPGSLRQAIKDSAPGDSIIFGVSGEIFLLSGELAVDKNLSIRGPDVSAVAISGSYLSRVFRINTNVTVAISGLTLQCGRSANGTDGSSGQSGGGIYNAGDLSVSNCTIAGNTTGSVGYYNSAGGNGGAIFNVGNLALTASVICDNWTGWGGSGGGLFNCGNSLLTGCRLTDNSTGSGVDGSPGFPSASGGGVGGYGGGIYSLSAITLINCTLQNNYCGSGGTGGAGTVFAGDGGFGGSGGAICAISDLTMTGCTVFGNQAGMGGAGGFSTNRFGWGGRGGHGGGILCGDLDHPGRSGTLALTNCTFAANCAGTAGYDSLGHTAGGRGGAIYSAASNHFIVACTIVSNSIGFGINLDGCGGGINADSMLPVCLLDVLVAGNVGPRAGKGEGPDICGAFNSLGHNLIGATNGCYGFFLPQDLVGSTNSPLNPKVGPLADNGGSTFTMALLPGSPAIDAGSAVGAPATDQRGIARPQGPSVDIGAFEFQYPTFTSAGIQNSTNCQLQLAGLEPNRTFTMLASSNLVTWSVVTSFTAGTNGLFQYSDPIQRNSRARFYRVKAGAP